MNPTCPLCSKTTNPQGGGLVGVTVYEEGDSGSPPPVRAYTGPPLRETKKPVGMTGTVGFQGGAGGGQKTVYQEDQESTERLMGFLIITASKEEDEFRYFRLTKGVNFIGRFGSRAAIELRDKEMSHQHALLICTNVATRVVDLDSKNGVKVNGHTQDLADLKEGDVLRMGRTEMVFVPFSFVADD